MDTALPETITHLSRPGRTRRQILLIIVPLMLVALVASRLASPATEVPAQQPSSTVQVAGTPTYAKDIAPILDRTCVSCHGPQRADKGLRLDSYQRTMAGDSYGTVLIPGDSSLSAMVSVVRYGTMPHGSTRLSPTEIEIMSRWIDDGAPEK